MFSAFQGNFVQLNAFQVIGLGSTVPTTPAPNGNREYNPSYYELENTRRKIKAYSDSEHEAKIELKSIDYRIEELELRRLRDLADENTQLQLLTLLKEQQIMQMILNELILEKEAMRREDEDILILMLSLPFNC